MRLFAVIDVEVVNLMRKKVEIDLIWFVYDDYLRCELHNCSNWTRCSVFTSVAMIPVITVPSVWQLSNY